MNTVPEWFFFSGKWDEPLNSWAEIFIELSMSKCVCVCWGEGGEGSVRLWESSSQSLEKKIRFQKKKKVSFIPSPLLMKTRWATSVHVRLRNHPFPVPHTHSARQEEVNLNKVVHSPAYYLPVKSECMWYPDGAALLPTLICVTRSRGAILDPL